jgi:hypothetical protein
MNDAVDATKPTFFTISAEGALKTVFRSYLQELCTLAEIERRVDAMGAKALQQRRDAGFPDMFSKDKQWARRLLRDSLLDHRAHFERIRRDFFLLDQFPENDQRFDVKFEDCHGRRHPRPDRWSFPLSPFSAAMPLRSGISGPAFPRRLTGVTTEVLSCNSAVASSSIT